MTSTSKNWCFTLNNYSLDELKRVESLYPSSASYLCFGKEIGESGTPHLQGYLQLKKNSRLSALKKLIPRAHFDIARGSPDRNQAYCSKDGDYVEFGTIKTERQRSDLDAFKQAVKDGLTLQELREQHSEVVAKYPRFVRDYMADQKEEPDIPNHALMVWQQDLYQSLIKKPDDRKIFFIVDTKGNKGKTWFIKYFCRLHPKAQMLAMGKQADMAYALDPDTSTLFINCTRTQAEFMNYSFLESVKDGLIFSSKYESRLVKIGLCHVVVMMNTYPDMQALSEDRYIIIDI